MYLVADGEGTEEGQQAAQQVEHVTKHPLFGDGEGQSPPQCWPHTLDKPHPANCDAAGRSGRGFLGWFLFVCVHGDRHADHN